jgi:type II secretion system protein G
MINKFPNSRGFTLIELLVVISIVGLLATLVVANLNSARARARDAARKSDLKNISTSLRLYFNDKSFYPANNSSGLILGCGSTGTSACTWGAPWVVGTTTYMQILPKDPISSQSYKYEVGATLDTFTLSSCLENKSDEAGIVTTDTSWCPSGWQYQVKI